ncbi:MAG: FMN-binding negative transcriptional regulator [Lautropia sp.]
MYLPAHFEQPDQAAVHRLMLDSPLATLVTCSDGAIDANHVPMIAVLRDRKIVLRFHVARANPLWRDADPAGEVLAIFQGPDTYISPSWYATKAQHGKVVPTWNYAVVHAYGRLTVFDDKEWLREFLPSLTNTHEARFDKPWQVGDAPDDYIETMMGSIVGLELEVGRVLAKWKMSQNQPAANRATLVTGLEQTSQPGAQAIGQLIAAQVPQRKRD